MDFNNKLAIRSLAQQNTYTIKSLEESRIEQKASKNKKNQTLG